MKSSRNVLLLMIISLLGFTIVLWYCSPKKVGPTEPIHFYQQSLMGQVLDAESYLTNTEELIAIKGATVRMNNGENVITDDEGYFSFTDIVPGDYTLEIIKEGYITNYLAVKELNFELGLPSIKLSKESEPVTIGTEGGVITEPGITMHIPPGALNASTGISVTQEVPSPDVPNSENLPLLQVVCLPENTVFNSPIEIRLALPPEFGELESLDIESFVYNKQTSNWEKLNLLSDVRDDSLSIYLNHFTRIFISALWHLEYEFTGPWSTSGGEQVVEAERLVGSLCCGKNQSGTIPGPSITMSKEISAGGAIGWRNIIEFSIGWSEGWSETVTCPSLNVSSCQCCELYATLYKQKMVKPYRWRLCNLIIFCSPWVNSSVSKYKYRYGSRSSCRANSIPECHDQGGGI